MKPEVFSLNFVPPQLLVRNSKVEGLLSDNIKFPKFVFGKKETGKTVTAKWMANNGLATYFHCATSLRETLRDQGGRAYSGAAAMDRLVAQKPVEPIIFDEVHLWRQYDRGDVSKTVHTLLDDYPGLKIIYITNVSAVEFFEGWLTPDIKERCGGKDSQIVFEDYSREQVEEIIQQRFDLAASECDQYVLHYLSAVYNTGTPLREILNALHSLALRRSRLDIDSVKDYFNKGVGEDLQKTFDSLEMPKALLLGSIARVQQLEGGKYQRLGYGHPTAGFQDVCIAYNSMVHDLPNGKELGGRTLHRYLDQLEEYYVKTEVGHLLSGRGITTYCSCLMDYNTVANAFKAWFAKRFGRDPFGERG